MAETIRAESLERRERVSKFAIEHMEQTRSFPSARVIQTKFLENQYPGNLNSIATDLKEVAKDISLVYQSKQTVDIDDDQIEIPKEALEFAVRSYQIIELQQRKKFDGFKEVVSQEVEASRQALSVAEAKVITMESEIEAKAEVLRIREEQLQEIKEKLAAQDKELKDAQTKARETELKNNELATELTATKKHLDNQYIQHENEVMRIDNKLITLQDKYQSLASENQTLKVSNDELNNKLSHITEERDGFSEENAQIKSEKICLINDISELKASNAPLSQERNIQKQQIDELRDVIQELNGKIQSFEGHLQGLSGK